MLSSSTRGIILGMKNVRTVCDRIAEGAPIEEACGEIGISHQQWLSWRRRNLEVRAQHNLAMRARAQRLR